MTSSNYYLQPGDSVIANHDILNDGSFPNNDSSAPLVNKDAIGVVINIGYLEENEDVIVFLVRFEKESKELGPPIGCWSEDIKPYEMDKKIG